MEIYSQKLIFRACAVENIDENDAHLAYGFLFFYTRLRKQNIY